MKAAIEILEVALRTAKFNQRAKHVPYPSYPQENAVTVKELEKGLACLMSYVTVVEAPNG